MYINFIEYGSETNIRFHELKSCEIKTRWTEIKVYVLAMRAHPMQIDLKQKWNDG